MDMSVQYISERLSRRVPRNLVWVTWTLIVCLLIAAIFGRFVVAYAWKALQQRDLRGARPFSANAVVIGKQFWTKGDGKKPPQFHYELTLKWNDHQATEREAATKVTETIYKRIREGHEVKINYRIGRSGTIYIDHIEPVFRTGLQQ